VDTSIVRCAVALFVAGGLRFAEREQDPTEIIQLVDVSLAAAVNKRRHETEVSRKSLIYQ
jgi:hypothetical protein